MVYIALLRGVNVGGKNRVPMKDLKETFLKIGFTNVSTYINSGNILFDTDSAMTEQELQNVCQQEIEAAFGFPVAVTIISVEALADAVQHAPKWWDNDPDYRHNTLFVIHPTTAEEVLLAIGEINEDLEKVAYYNNVIFWASSIDKRGYTRYAKIAGTKAYKQVTIRNANTTKKLLLMSKNN